MSVCMCNYVPCTASVSSRHVPGQRLRHSGQLQGASRHSFSVLPLTGRSSSCRQVQVQAAGVHNLGAGGVGGGRCGARIAEERPKLLGVRGRNERGFLRCRAESDDGSSRGRAGSALEDPPGTELQSQDQEDEEVIPENSLSKWLYPPAEELPDEKEMTIFDHLEELRDRLLISVAAVGVAMGGCFFFAKDLIVILEKPVYSLGVRFLALSPGEYFFTTLKVSGYCGLLLGSPIILYELIAFVIPGLTRSERRFLGPIVLGSSVLFYTGLGFSYAILTPAALSFFVSYAEGVVESLWSIDQYFEFVLVLMFSTGLAFQVPVIQLLLGQTRLVNGDQMLSVWRYVVVGAVIAAAVLTPSTDPLTQCLLAGPLIGLYMGGAFLVKFLIPETDALEG